MDNTSENKVSYKLSANVLMSSGPRKKSTSDTELGEDVVGMDFQEDCITFWILDGTSEKSEIFGQTGNFLAQESETIVSGEKENPQASKVDDSVIEAIPGPTESGEESAADKKNSVEIECFFSSRLLALSLQRYLQAENFVNIDIETIKNAVSKVATKLEERINKNLSEKQKEQIKIMLENEQRFEISTTLVLGRFHKSGALKYLCLGDSSLIAMGKTSSKRLAQDRNEPLGCQLIFDTIENNFKIKTSLISEHSPVDALEIDTIFAFSDGIGKLAETRIENKVPSDNWLSLVLETLEYPHRTYDDKSIIILKRTPIDESNH